MEACREVDDSKVLAVQLVINRMIRLIAWTMLSDRKPQLASDWSGSRGPETRLARR